MRCWGRALNGRLGYCNETAIGDAVVDDQPAKRGAALARGAGRRKEDRALSEREVGAWGDDHRVIAAKLKQQEPKLQEALARKGWQIETVKGKYDKTYPYYHGQQLTEGVKEIVWSGGKLPDEHYDEFVFISYLADELQPNSTLYFPVVQECEQGVERWIDQAAPGTKEAADHSDTPAPALQLLPKP